MDDNFIILFEFLEFFSDNKGVTVVLHDCDDCIPIVVDDESVRICVFNAVATGCNVPFSNVKHVESGFATPEVTDVLSKKNLNQFEKIYKEIQILFLITYKGPGKRLAVLTIEYGIIKIGFVGNAKNG